MSPSSVRIRRGGLYPLLALQFLCSLYLSSQMISIAYCWPGYLISSLFTLFAFLCATLFGSLYLFTVYLNLAVPEQGDGHWVSPICTPVSTATLLLALIIICTLITETVKNIILYLFSVNTFTPIERCGIIFVISQVARKASDWTKNTKATKPCKV